jgi:hypothetical protein
MAVEINRIIDMLEYMLAILYDELYMHHVKPQRGSV